jgi:hypothetical protein
MFGLISFHYIPMGHCVPMEIISLLLPPKVTKTLKIANVVETTGPTHIW